VSSNCYRITPGRNALGLAVGCFALLFPCLAWAQQPGHSRPQPIVSTPFSGGVTAQGRIVPLGGVVRVAAPAGSTGQAMVDQLLVKQGDTVTTGQLLAVLHGKGLLDAQVDAAVHDQATAVAALAQAGATQAHATAEIQVQVADLEGRAAIADATAHHAAVVSQLALDEAKGDEATAKIAVETAKRFQLTVQAATAANVALAQAQLDIIPKSRVERPVAAAQLEAAKAEKIRGDAEAAGQVEQAQAKADLAAIHVHQVEAALIVEPAPDDLSKLAPVQAEARAARASAAAAAKLLESVQAERVPVLAAAQARVEAAESALAVARSQLAMSEVRAPAAGKVLAVLARAGEAVGPAGLLQLGDTHEINVDALVYIDDLPGVHVGQKTLTTGSALPDDGLFGSVVEISPTVVANTLPNTDPTVFSDQPVVLVKVRLDNPEPAANLINGQVKVQFAP